MREEKFFKMEFAVNMTSEMCGQTVRGSLDGLSGIKSVTVDVSNQRVVVETDQPSSVIQNALESTGMLAVFRGQGSVNLGAAASILKNGNKMFGLVRFIQIQTRTKQTSETSEICIPKKFQTPQPVSEKTDQESEDRCVVDGSFSGLEKNKSHRLYIHQYGDLSDGADSTGDVYCTEANENPPVGDLGALRIDEDGNAVMRYISNRLKVHDIIGRAAVLRAREDESWRSLAYGIIARSAGLFQNDKKVCTCSGKTIWEERQDIKSDSSIFT